MGRDPVPCAECRRGPKDLLCDENPHFFQFRAIKPFHRLYLCRASRWIHIMTYLDLRDIQLRAIFFAISEITAVTSPSRHAALPRWVWQEEQKGR